MILSLALLLPSLAFPTAEAARLSDFHPKQSELYIELPELQAVGDVLDQLPLMRLLHDPEVQAAIAALGGPEDGFNLFEYLSKPTGNEEFDKGLGFVRRLESISISMRRIVQEPSGLILAEMSGDVADEAWEAAFAMLDVDLRKVDVESDPSSLDKETGKYTNADQGRYAFLFGEKQSYWVLSSDLAPKFRAWMQAVDGRMVIGFGDTSRASLKNFAAGESMTGSREMVRMGLTQAEIQGQAIMSATGQLDFERIFKDASGEQAETTQSSAADDKSDKVRPGAFSYSLSFDGERYQSAARVAMPQLPELDQASAAKLIPADSIGALAASIDFGFVLQFAKKAMEAGGSSGPEAAGMQKLMGSVLGNMGPQAVIFSPPVGGVTLPAVQMWCDIKDVESFGKGLDAISALMASGNSGGLTFKREEYRDVTYWVLDHGRSTGMVTIMPSFALLDGKLYACLEPRLMKRLLRDRRKGEQAAPTGRHAFFDTLEPKGLASALFFDWGELFGGYYGAALSMSGFAGQMLGIEIDPESLPKPDLFKRHLTPWKASLRNDGGFLHYNSKSSFGPEFMLPFVAGIMNAALLEADEAPSRSVQVAPAASRD